METEQNNNVKQAKFEKSDELYESKLIIQNYDSPPGVEKQNVIRLEDLEHYVKTMNNCGGFLTRFEMLKTGQLKPWEAAKKPENKSKNRYADLLPYDETRVILQKLKNDPDSDYINASYIDGYNHPKAYISTQGPLDKTINDFWRMIWQESITKIIMAANIIENGKKKCEIYWPEATKRYGDILVSLQSEQVFVDFIIRTFKVHKAGHSSARHIRQFHYTAWPDHGIPAYPLSMVLLLNYVKKYHKNDNAPVVVHCSAGVGRSGTVILLDAALDMLGAEGTVDVFSLLYKMRQQRVNLVETIDQYTFVYKALIDYHFGDITSNPSQGFVLYYNKLRMVDSDKKKSGLQLQFEELEKLTPPFTEDKCLTAVKGDNKSKNRSLDILPSEGGRVLLKSGNSIMYMNAVYVNGYGSTESYVVTQYPLPETVNDFWQLVHDVGSSIMVVLNDFDEKDETTPIPWPESGTVYRGNYRIDHVMSKATRGGVVRHLKLRNMDQGYKTRKIRQFQLKGCKINEMTHPALNNVIYMLNKIARWQHKSKRKPVIVMCYNGSTMSGFFCASAYLRDQLRNQGTLDVFEAVRTVRINRPSFIPVLNQYRWLYEVGCALISTKRSRRR